MKRRLADGSRVHGILAVARLHRPYASMNWIRFNGSLRALAVSQPLAGTPLVNGAIRNGYRRGVKMVFEWPPPARSGPGEDVGRVSYLLWIVLPPCLQMQLLASNHPSRMGRGEAGSGRTIVVGQAEAGTRRKKRRKALWAAVAVIAITAAGMAGYKTIVEKRVSRMIAERGGKAGSVEADFLGRIHLRDVALPLKDGSDVRIAAVDGRPVSFSSRACSK